MADPRNRTRRRWFFDGCNDTFGSSGWAGPSTPPPPPPARNVALLVEQGRRSWTLARADAAGPRHRWRIRWGVTLPADLEARTGDADRSRRRGPAGLAAAAALVRAGARVELLERSDQVGASWAARYNSLHLHTVRWLSALPGLRIPREHGRWVARDDLVRYLSSYADLHHLLPAARGLHVDSIKAELSGLLREIGLEARGVGRALAARG